MSKHLGRKQRWTQQSTRRYTSSLGSAVYGKGAWWGLLEYQTLVPPAEEHALLSWEEHRTQLGPYKRPRNAMVAVEREATMLQNRYGEQLRLRGPSGAEVEPFTS